MLSKFSAWTLAFLASLGFTASSYCFAFFYDRSYFVASLVCVMVLTGVARWLRRYYRQIHPEFRDPRWEYGGWVTSFALLSLLGNLGLIVVGWLGPDYQYRMQVGTISAVLAIFCCGVSWILLNYSRRKYWPRAKKGKS